jgi:hypothetical protein
MPILKSDFTTTGMPKADDIAKLTAEVLVATDEHQAAERATTQARSAETAALNRLNECQRKLDAAMLNLRKGANIESGWGEQRRERHPVEPS